MAHKIVVGYDGSESAKRAVQFAAASAKERGASILVCHILEWSPYAFLTPTEIEERHKRRNDELARAESAILAPVVAELANLGVTAETSLKYGHIVEALCQVATENGADQIVIGRTGHSKMSVRVFGSVAGSLAQSAPVPVTIIP